MTENTYRLSELLLLELTTEFAKTRKSLERAPDSQTAFRPHKKSMSLIDLCNHLTTVAGVTGTILTVSDARLGGSDDPRRIVKESNTAALLEVFDELARIQSRRAPSNGRREFSDDLASHAW